MEGAASERGGPERGAAESDQDLVFTVSILPETAGFFLLTISVIRRVSLITLFPVVDYPIRLRYRQNDLEGGSSRNRIECPDFTAMHGDYPTAYA